MGLNNDIHTLYNLREKIVHLKAECQNALENVIAFEKRAKIVKRRAIDEIKAIDADTIDEWLHLKEDYQKMEKQIKSFESDCNTLEQGVKKVLENLNGNEVCARQGNEGAFIFARLNGDKVDLHAG